MGGVEMPSRACCTAEKMGSSREEGRAGAEDSSVSMSLMKSESGRRVVVGSGSMFVKWSGRHDKASGAASLDPATW
jgi:hypothetical protein